MPKHKIQTLDGFFNSALLPKKFDKGKTTPIKQVTSFQPSIQVNLGDSTSYNICRIQINDDDNMNYTPTNVDSEINSELQNIYVQTEFYDGCPTSSHSIFRPQHSSLNLVCSSIT